MQLSISVGGATVFLRGMGDRKSTRLNSSHQIISYAVFCLKKQIMLSLTAFNALTLTGAWQASVRCGGAEPMYGPRGDGKLSGLFHSLRLRSVFFFKRPPPPQHPPSSPHPPSSG